MLTNTQIKRLKPKDKTYRIADSDGLALEIRTNGRKFWRWRYQNHDGKWSMKSLGEYPDISIEVARVLRDDQRSTSDFAKATFEDAAKQWYATQSYTSDKNAKQVWSMIDTYLLPRLGGVRMADIKAQDILPILKDIEKRGKLEQCKRVRTKASQIFRYGVANLMCEYDPTLSLKDATAKPKAQKRSAIIDEYGFARLLKTIEAAQHLSPSVKIGLQLSAHVFLRSSELRKTTVDMIDLNNRLWTLPAEIMKKKKDHMVPLSDQVIELLKKAFEYKDPLSNLLLPGHRRGRPLSENTFNVALSSMGITGDLHVQHGFRASFSTLGREIHRFDNDLIERQLAHVQKDSVRAAYDRSYRIEDRAVMLQTWSDYLDRLLQQKTDR